ncbi:thioredoxin-dependent peroxidase [Pisolithus croceorrhizus]|nr:thioredoxin-dependent peroxidase [Pisolithus croceorrhizus]KAI6120209.1 thioredoxin-dependent peroxidase [Pisolithus croceorrhizus]KAI6169848.1 thioredoxin-dependent peroxidase [Pisolithus thermaeus]
MTTSTIAVGDRVPEGKLSYIPHAPELDDPLACGSPTTITTTEFFAGKKVVLVSVPGAFTPTCHVNHLPPFLARYDEFRSKGVDIIAVLAANDAFVMSGWARVQGLKDKILALSDGNAEWSKAMGLTVDLSHVGFGLRTARYAIVLDDLVVRYLGVEPARGVTVSGADAVLEAL